MSVRHLQALMNRQTALLLAFSLIVLNLMLLSGGARALHTYPTFVDVGTNGGSIPDGGDLVVPVPGGAASGDLLLAQIGYNAVSGATITPGPGWTLVSVEDDGGSDIKHGIYWRIATASEPSDYAFTLTSGTTDTAAGAIAAYRGVDTVNPIHTFASQDNGTALALDAPSVSTTLAGTTVLALYTVRDLNQIDPPGGMTERWDAGSVAGVGDIDETRIEVAEEQWGAAGPTGIRTATATASNGSVAHMIALAPPPTAPTFEVNSTRDVADTNPGDGLCNTGSINTASEPECTLRAALEESNVSGGTDTVTFNIPSSELGFRAAPVSWVIAPTAALPIATNPVNLDARTQPGWSGDPIVELNMTDAAGSVAGLVLWTDDSLIAGFAIHSSPDDGIEVDGTAANGNAADRNVVRDNWVGLDATGAAIGNADIGILVTDNADDNQVIDNVVGASGTDGIVVRTDSTRNLVTGNFVGVTSDLATAIPNGGHGIHIYESAWDNTVGGTFPTDANTVANNPLNGITLDADAGIGNALLRNIVYDNTLLGIDLGNDGPTPNDPGDGDGPGPNNYINFPQIQAAVERSGTVTVYYRLDAPAGNYRVEFFSNPSGGDVPGGEAEVYEGAHTITGHPGNLQYFASFPASAGDVITATATRMEGALFGSTSEYADNVAAILADFRVNSTGDAGDNNIRDGVCDTGGPPVSGRPECTLRAAIQETDALNLADVITFDIPATDTGHAAGVWTISPSSPLPTVNDEVVIDATTQPGFVANPVIRVDGTSAGVASGFHLGIGSSDSVLRGFMITRFTVDGVVLTSGIGGMTVENNWIGTDGSGAAANGAGDDGIEINAQGSTIRNNVIVNNGDEGIDVREVGVTIQGNIIGLEPDGSSGTGNVDVGIALWSDGTIIGGDTGAERNVISNNWEAIEVNSSNNVIQGNFIGTDATGALDRGNRIGDGIQILSGTDNLIGGTNPGEGNVIAYNQQEGVDVTGGTDNAIVGNNIHSNGGLGIDLGTTGVTGNDPGDGDGGPNTLQNFPEIQSAVEDTGSVTVTFDLDTAPGSYRVEFFTNPNGIDPSGNGEGEIYVDAVTTAPGIGLTHSIPGTAGDAITATATFISGTLRSTSEFSPAETVTDGTAPIITLLGANPQTIEVGSPYVELGATALDDVDGDITGSITIDASAVNTAVLGSYIVTYDVTDSSGNPAVQVTRTVDVVDTTAPVITLVGANPQTIEVGSPYVELGATALDNYDGDITGSIVIDASAVNTAVLGSYIVTYDVTDSEGNPAVQVTRTVDVVDTTAPVITLVGADPQTIEVGSPYVELGATAADNYDGDITGSIVIDASAVNTAVLGSYPVTYDVSDSSGNPAVQVTRTVDVVDTTAPVITLLGADPQTIEVGSPYVELGATALDNLDGDITGSIVIDASAVNTALLGSYIVTYDVTDSSGNPAVQVTRTVDVVDTTAPVITLVGANPQAIEVGSPYVELGATASDNLDGDITGSIVIDASAVNTAVLGSYPVTYDVTDSNGNPAVQVTRTVNIVDTTAPVITLIGPNPQTIEIGSPYSELGATASDNYDGDITGSIVIDSSSVNTAVVGVYIVTYDVADSSGNTAAATRTIRVVDTNDPPVIAPIADQTGAELTLITFVAAATDPEGHAVRYSLLGEPGNASIDPASGVFTWTPNEAQGPGTYTFDVAATDNGTPHRVAIQTVTITVLETNQAPIIGSLGSRTSSEGDLVFLQATATDLDLPANTLRFSALNLPPGLAISSSGLISGTVAEGAAAGGPYNVRVTVTDNGAPALSSSVSFVWTVEATINQPPVAIDDLYSMPFSGPLTVDLPGVLGNDIDPDGDALGVSLAGPPPVGTLTLNPDGSFTYSPDPGQQEPAVFTYRVDDGRGGFDTATVTVLMAANRPPIAAANTYRLDTFGRSVLTVLGNDSDPDGDTIMIVDIVTTGTKGDVYMRGDVIDYYPAEDWIGDDFFAYVIEDTAGNTAVGQVHMIIEEEAGGNGERVTGVIGVPRAVFVSPPSTETVSASIGLDVTISLLQEAFWQSLDALRLPLIFLVLAVLAVLLLGGITEAPVLLAASRRKFWAVVMLSRERTLTVHTDPDPTSDVMYNFAPTSTGIMSLERPHRGYMPVDSPRGNGWVDMDFLTPATDLEYFMRDQRPVRLVEDLRSVLEDRGDFSKLVSHRGYAIALGAEMVQIPQHLAIASRSEVAAGNVPSATADLQEEVLEAIRQALLDLADISHDMAHDRAALIPTELWNFPYLAIHAPGHENWLIHFEYEERKPYIVGISLDQ